MDIDPRACIGSFFDRIQVAEVGYKQHFDDEVKSFKERITKRAAEKIDEALAEQEEEERKERLGKAIFIESIHFYYVHIQRKSKTWNHFV